MGRTLRVAAAVIAGLAIGTPVLAAAPGVWSGGGPAAGVLSSLAVDPADPQVVYGGGFEAIYRSDDGAASWQSLPLPPEVPAGVGTIAVDPATPGTLYLNSDAQLFRSSDSGRTWTALAGIGFVSTFVLLPGERTGLLAATFETGLQRSADGGATWEPSSEGLPEPNFVFGLTVAPSDADVVYALAGESLFRSSDGGQSWSAASTPPELGFVSSLSVDPSDPRTLYTAGQFRVFRSVDGGMTWKEQSDGLAVAEDGFIAALVAAGAPTTLYALTDRALFRSTDAGGEWSLVNDDELNRFAPWLIAVDPTDPAHLYRATGLGVFVSSDGGVSFAPASAGLPGLATQVVAAGSGDRVHAALFLGGVVTSTDGGITWRPGTGADIEAESLMAIAAEPAGERVYAGSYRGRFFRSDDGGSTWASMGFRLPFATIWGIAPDPGRAGRVLAATELGVYRSGTAGESWRRFSRGLPNTGVRVLAFAGSAPNIVYAGLDRRGVFRSSDGGRSWRAAGLAGSTVLSLGVDPRQPKVVYAATRSGGAFRSDNSGRTWKRLADTGLTASVVLDPEAPDTVLLGTDGRVLRSTNRGANLVSYKEGLPSHGGSPLDPEASSPLTVVGLAAVPGGAYAATWSGVFGVEFE